jgi:hypothetical protein
MDHYHFILMAAVLFFIFFFFSFDILLSMLLFLNRGLNSGLSVMNEGTIIKRVLKNTFFVPDSLFTRRFIRRQSFLVGFRLIIRAGESLTASLWLIHLVRLVYYPCMRSETWNCGLS